MFALETSRESRSLRAPALRGGSGRSDPSGGHEAESGWYATVIHDGAEVANQPLAIETIVGRACDCQILLEDPARKVSRMHARIDLNGRITVTDLGSRTGTIVVATRLEPNICTRSAGPHPAWRRAAGLTARHWGST